MKYLIAPLKSTEKRGWGQLWGDYQQFYRTELTAEVTERTWQRLQSGRIGGHGAHDAAGSLVGIVHFLFHEDTWSVRPACYLQDLYVDATARGQGCARQLIESVVYAAEAAGANPPYWLTHETNMTARRLYDRLGKNLGFIQYVYGSQRPLASTG